MYETSLLCRSREKTKLVGRKPNQYSPHEAACLATGHPRIRNEEGEEEEVDEALRKEGS